MKVDWFRLIVDLEREGFTLRYQSEAVHVSPATIHYWKCGSGEPRYSHGCRLIELYQETLHRAAPLQTTYTSTYVIPAPKRQEPPRAAFLFEISNA